MSLKERTIKGFAWNHLSKLMDYALTYLLSILFARKLAAANYGVYVTMMSVASLALIVGAGGIDETLNKYISQLLYSSKPAKIRFLLRKLIKIRIIAVVLLSLLLFVFKSNLNIFFQNDNVSSYIAVLIYYILSQSLVNFFANIYTAQLKTKYVFFVSITAKLLNIILSFVLLELDYGLTSIFILFSITSFISLFLYSYKAKELLVGESDNLDMKPIYGFSSVTWLNAFLTMALGRYSAIILLSYFFGKTPLTGYYDIAFSLTILIDYVFTIGLTGVWLSIMSEIAVRDSSRLAEARAKLIKFQQFFIIPVGFFSFIYPEFIIKFLFSDKYLPAVPLFRIYLVFLLLSMIIANRENLGFLLAIDKQKIAIIIRIIIGILNITVSFLIIPSYGAIGAITVTGASILLSNICEFVVTSKFIGLKYDIIFTLKVLIVSLISIGIVSFINANNLISFILAGLFYLILIGTGYGLTKIIKINPKDLLNPVGMNKIIKQLMR